MEKNTKPEEPTMHTTKPKTTNNKAQQQAVKYVKTKYPTQDNIKIDKKLFFNRVKAATAYEDLDLGPPYFDRISTWIRSNPQGWNILNNRHSEMHGVVANRQEVKGLKNLLLKMQTPLTRQDKTTLREILIRVGKAEALQKEVDKARRKYAAVQL